MYSYEFDVRVITRTVSDWFWDRECAGCLFAKDELGIMNSINDAYPAIYEETTHHFHLASENLILTGLQNLGLMHCCPGIMNYHIKSWSKKECVVTVELEIVYEGAELSECREKEEEIVKKICKDNYSPVVVSGYSEREMKVMKRIQKFFSSTAVVVTWDRQHMTGFPSD